MAGLRKSAATAILLNEFGERPLQHLWTEGGVIFWNSLLALPEDSIYRRVALKDFCDAISRG